MGTLAAFTSVTVERICIGSIRWLWCAAGEHRWQLIVTKRAGGAANGTVVLPWRPEADTNGRGITACALDGWRHLVASPRVVRRRHPQPDPDAARRVALHTQASNVDLRATWLLARKGRQMVCSCRSALLQTLCTRWADAVFRCASASCGTPTPRCLASPSFFVCYCRRGPGDKERSTAVFCPQCAACRTSLSGWVSVASTGTSPYSDTRATSYAVKWPCSLRST